MGNVMEQLIDTIDNEEIRQFKIQQAKESYFIAYPRKEINTWTEDAYHCFIIGGDCNHCPIKTHYGLDDQCQMRESLKDLITNVGFPRELDIEYQTQKLRR